MSLEYCIECDQETGNAGIGDDSLYLEDGRGPYCDCCYYKNRVEELETEIERLRRVEEQYKELKAAAWKVEKAFLHNEGSMDMAIDTLSDLLQEGE